MLTLAPVACSNSSDAGPGESPVGGAGGGMEGGSGGEAAGGGIAGVGGGAAGAPVAGAAGAPVAGGGGMPDAGASSDAAAGAVGLTACVLPLGDSITQGDGTRKSYRYALWEKLQAAGLHANFVGSLRVNHIATPKFDDPTFDPDHEGHWGLRADEVLAGLPTWSKGYTPGIALIHLGTNDAWTPAENPVEGTIGELEKIIAFLRSKNPGVAVLLAKLISTTNGFAAPYIAALNELIPGLVTKLDTPESRVILVDQNTGFDPALLTSKEDGLHPNEAGEAFMADRWFAALAPLLRQAAPCPP